MGRLRGFAGFACIGPGIDPGRLAGPFAGPLGHAGRVGLPGCLRLARLPGCWPVGLLGGLYRLRGRLLGRDSPGGLALVWLIRDQFPGGFRRFGGVWLVSAGPGFIGSGRLGRGSIRGGWPCNNLMKNMKKPR